MSDSTKPGYVARLRARSMQIVGIFSENLEELENPAQCSPALLSRDISRIKNEALNYRILIFVKHAFRSKFLDAFTCELLTRNHLT